MAEKIPEKKEHVICLASDNLMKYKEEPDLDKWYDFPELMWKLGFEMDCGSSFNKYADTCGIKVKEPANKREERKTILYLLEHADRQIVGNFLFSEWRYWTHWDMWPYDEYEIDFMCRIIDILIEKMNE